LVGSTIISSSTGGLPFIGITSLGTVAAVGFVVLVGGAAVLSAIGGLVAVALVPPVLVGTAAGSIRRLEKIGGRGRKDGYLRGLKLVAEKYWLGILATVAVFGLLAAVLTNAI